MIEFLVVLLVLFVLGALLWASLPRMGAPPRSKALRLDCCNNLRQMGVGFRLVTPKFLVCPADKRKPATNFPSLTIQNVSYFLGLDADESRPQMTLAGDRNLTTNGVPVGPGLVEIRAQSVFHPCFVRG